MIEPDFLDDYIDNYQTNEYIFNKKIKTGFID